MAQVLDLSAVEGFNGELLRDGDPGYEDARRVFNAGIESLVESLDVGTAGLSGWVVNVYPELVQWLAEHGSAASPEAVRLQAALDAVERTMAPSYPASAKRLHSSRSKTDHEPDSLAAASSFLRWSCVACSVRICRASSCNDRWSSVIAKSIRAPSRLSVTKTAE